MMATILKFVLSVILAVAGSMAGQRWIGWLYASAPAVLSYPEKVVDNVKKRQSFLTMALGFLLCFASLQGDYGTVSAWLSAMIVIYFCVLFSATDWEQHVIFDRMLIPFAVLGLLFTLITGGLLNHLLAAAAGGIGFLLLSILTRGGIGGGDIKLIAALGLWFGTEALTHIAMTGIVLAGLVALVLLLTRQKGRLDYMAYGPYFALAAILTIIF
ncbi:MAG: prepilin peptidase [Selenomonas sp.]|nr:prepilin peptidase [Selenomonas sp.]